MLSGFAASFDETVASVRSTDGWNSAEIVSVIPLDSGATTVAVHGGQASLIYAYLVDFFIGTRVDDYYILSVGIDAQ